MEIINETVIEKFWYKILPSNMATKENSIVWEFYDCMPKVIKY